LCLRHTFVTEHTYDQEAGSGLEAARQAVRAHWRGLGTQRVAPSEADSRRAMGRSSHRAQRHVLGARFRCTVARHARAVWPWETVYGRFRRWTDEGLIDRMLQQLHVSLDEDGRIDWSVFDVDGSSIRVHVSAAGGAASSKQTVRRARRLRLGTIPRRLWHEASSCRRWPGHSPRGDDLGGPASRVDLLRTAHGHGEDLPSAASGPAVGRWCREARATAIRGFGRGCVAEASRASSRRVPIRPPSLRPRGVPRMESRRAMHRLAQALPPPRDSIR